MMVNVVMMVKMIYYLHVERQVMVTQKIVIMFNICITGEESKEI
jgi:hypothetical protein